MKRKVLWQNDFVILYDAGDFHKYDGLTGLFVKLVNADNELLKDAYMKKWYRRKTKEISTEAAKYYPDEAMIEEEMERVGKAVSVYEITIEHLSGKEIQER